MPTAAEIAHRSTAPQVPRAPMENPRDAIRKPGLHRAITNPSHHRSAFSRCRSSTYASAIWAPPFTPGKRCLARSDRYVYMPLVCVTSLLLGASGPVPGIMRPVRTVADRLQCGHARGPDHGPLRLRRRRLRAARRAVAVRQVRAHLEHRPDPRGRVLGDHAGHAAPPDQRDGHRGRDYRADRGPGADPRPAAADPAPSADDLLVHVLHAAVAASGARARQEPDPVEAA